MLKKVLFLFICFSLIFSVHASEQEPDTPEWLPEAKEYDWVQLTSGEWLKGEIKSMYNDSLVFESDILDELSIDWADVQYLKSQGASNINVEGYEPVSGKLEITGDIVSISNGSGTQTYDRSLLISLTPTGENESDLWTIKLSLGLDIKRGNTEQFDYLAKFSARRRTARSRFVIDYIGNISKSDSAGTGTLTETANNHRIYASTNKYVTRYFFYTPAFAELYRDEFQNLRLRATLGAGIGYTILDTGRYEWNVNGGPAYVSTEYLSVLPGEDEKLNSGALILATDFDAELTSTLDFIFNYKIQASKPEAGGYTHHMIATFESEITGSLDFDISLIWDRISQPKEDDQGLKPESDDYQLLVGVTYTY